MKLFVFMIAGLFSTFANASTYSVYESTTDRQDGLYFSVEVDRPTPNSSQDLPFYFINIKNGEFLIQLPLGTPNYNGAADWGSQCNLLPGSTYDAQLAFGGARWAKYRASMICRNIKVGRNTESVTVDLDLDENKNVSTVRVESDSLNVQMDLRSTGR